MLLLVKLLVLAEGELQYSTPRASATNPKVSAARQFAPQPPASMPRAGSDGVTPTGLADVNGRPHWAAMYIDDVMGVSADDSLVDREGRPALDGAGIQRRRAQAHFEAARGVLERFGWPPTPPLGCRKGRMDAARDRSARWRRQPALSKRCSPPVPTPTRPVANRQDRARAGPCAPLAYPFHLLIS